MKVLFLDHDGVLSLPSEPYDGTRESAKFNHKAVKVLNEIITQIPEVEIVVSSDWRMEFSLNEIRKLYIDQGIIKQPIGYTCYSLLNIEKKYEQARVEEIFMWLRQHNLGMTPLKDWVAVDDMDLKELGDNFVHVSRFREGIKQSGIKEKIIQKLTK